MPRSRKSRRPRRARSSPLVERGFARIRLALHNAGALPRPACGGRGGGGGGPPRAAGGGGGGGGGPLRESERVEAPPHRAESWFSLDGCRPLPASGARSAAAPAIWRSPILPYRLPDFGAEVT